MKIGNGMFKLYLVDDYGKQHFEVESEGEADKFHITISLMPDYTTMNAPVKKYAINQPDTFKISFNGMFEADENRVEEFMSAMNRANQFIKDIRKHLKKEENSKWVIL